MNAQLSINTYNLNMYLFMYSFIYLCSCFGPLLWKITTPLSLACRIGNKCSTEIHVVFGNLSGIGK